MFRDELDIYDEADLDACDEILGPAEFGDADELWGGEDDEDDFWDDFWEN